MPVTERPILLTGATGFVGMAVLARLLAADHEVHCLIRASDDAEADSRLRAVLHRVQAPANGRAVAIAGDLTAPRPGARPSATTRSPRGWGPSIHSAASVAFDLPLEEARAINVEGTRRVLDFAGAVPDLQRVAYVSTAYVAGDRRGTVYEDDRETGPVPQLLRALQARGRGPRALEHAAVDDRAPEHHRRREHHRLDGVLQRPLRAAARLRRRRATRCCPARRRSPVDVVPVDYVADAIAALARHPEAAGADLSPDRGLARLERRRDHVAGDRRASSAASRARAAARLPPARAPARPAPRWRRRRAGCSSAARSTSRTSRCACASTTAAPARCSSRWGSRPRAWRTTSSAHRVRARDWLGQGRSTAAPLPRWRGRRRTCARPSSARRRSAACPRRGSAGRRPELGVVLDERWWPPGTATSRLPGAPACSSREPATGTRSSPSACRSSSRSPSAPAAARSSAAPAGRRAPAGSARKSKRPSRRPRATSSPDPPGRSRPRPRLQAGAGHEGHEAAHARAAQRERARRQQRRHGRDVVERAGAQRALALAVAALVEAHRRDARGAQRAGEVEVALLPRARAVEHDHAARASSVGQE